ncbi:MAG TPA: ribonuclease HII [Solirubrobacterales bacterium]|nr:ribonuclease HII [Solirubrobacterales bacterium]HNC14355.1 ribonuclease HII [Solirubrobacterales bacterium]HNN19011.1 ribonuclease HII [Solirubrobacterales bacterium]
MGSSTARTPAAEQAPGELFSHDLELGASAVAGADEAGRGCLAGPIVAAAVLFDRECLESQGGGRLAEIRDSKKLTARARERLYPEVLDCAVKTVVVMRSARYIDANGLHVSNMECLARAIEGLGSGPEAVTLVDGFALKGCEVPHRRLVKGDSTSAAIAAASILAKVTRDRCMARAGLAYDGYGFEAHKGYASPAHRDAIRLLGPSPIHRLSFASEAYQA